MNYITTTSSTTTSLSPERGFFSRDPSLSREDFVVVGRNIDITREGLLKILNCVEEYEIQTEIVKSSSEEYIVKATVVVFANGKKRVGTGHGHASISEVEERREGNPRILHDTLALAETRAIKRAIEFALGTDIVNDFVRKLFLEEERGEEKKEEKKEERKEEKKENDDIEKIQTFTKNHRETLMRYMNEKGVERLSQAKTWDEWRKVLIEILRIGVENGKVKKEILSELSSTWKPSAIIGILAMRSVS